jgi:outer membrane lipopolysaccharide assembly protein LptE/RlpB
MRAASPESRVPSRVASRTVDSPESRVSRTLSDGFCSRLGTRGSRLWFLLVVSTRYSVLLSAALLLSTGCGYHTAGHAVQLPENVKTIAVPAFKNETSTYRIEQLLTASVVREFTTRTHYRILSDPGEEADATLRGTVLSTATSPLAYDTSSGRAASVLVVVSMKVSLSDRQGKVLYQNPAYVFREQYEVSQDLTSFFEEDSPAFRRLSQDFARTLVSNILEGF